MTASQGEPFPFEPAPAPPPAPAPVPALSLPPVKPRHPLGLPTGSVRAFLTFMVLGTFWVLLIAYLTVFLPLGVRAISGVIMQIDKSLDECGQVCGASWGYRLRSITMPLLKPGLLAAWFRRSLV